MRILIRLQSTWYDEDAVPKVKPDGKLLRLSEATSRMGGTTSAKVTDGNVQRRRLKRGRRKTNKVLSVIVMNNEYFS